MKKAIAVVATVGILSTAGGTAAWAAAGNPPPDGTITDVSGDKRNGFTVEHYDGTVRYPPKISEAKAECDEYGNRVNRVRCRTEVIIWYRDLQRMKVSLDYANAG
ncbi:hypothetical protein [Nocardioides ungokensis]|uniref:hypothetical protein n=1 Tax=Nocardioides ungokensis TaxID=1643322 RepID=UPI0015DDFDE2|nr:hypothetical protein [Nocardioides ungokensis]